MNRKHLLPLFLVVLAIISFTNIIPVHASINLVSIGANATLECALDGTLTHGCGQGSWQVSQTAFVTQITINLGKLGSPTGTGVVKIFNDANTQNGGFCSTSGASVIGSPIDISNTFDVSTVASGFGAQFTVTFPNLVSLNSLNCYDWVVSQETGTTDVNNVLRFTASSTEFGPAGSGALLATCTPAPTCSVGGSNDASGWEIDGVLATSTTTVNQCVGNCGNPAVTATNTNSTHTINFNISQTYLYIQQVNINGFIQNVTANIACTYGGTVCTKSNTIFTGIYLTASSCLNQAPFGPNCPGQLIFSFSQLNPSKGKYTNSFSSSVLSGQWIGVAFSASQSGIDINDTNTNVAISNTAGIMPTSISSVTSQGNSKANVYAWIVGNVVSSGTPPTGPSGPCGLLDCVLLGLIQSGCGIQTSACLVGAGFFWMILLSGVVIGFVMWGQHRVGLPNMIPGEFFVFVPISFTFLFFEIGIFPFWVPIFMFIVLLLLFASMITGKIGGKGGLQV